MNSYITGNTIKELREKKGLTQSELAKKLGITDKAVSKWETGKGLPDITLLEPISRVFGVSVAELISGETVTNKNVSANMLRARFYVCPVCGNVMWSVGESVISCHGIVLPALSAETSDTAHQTEIENVEDEYFVSVNHPMKKDHYISFVAAVSDNGIQIYKLYPEQDAAVRFKRNRVENIYFYCNKDGLFKVKM